MVVKFGVQQSRGAAGQTSVGGPKRNFANLYSMNRADDQTASQVGKIQQKTQGAQMQVDRLGQQASQAAGRGLGGQKQPMNQMAAAVQNARQGSQQAMQYNPAVSMMKSGASPYQSSIGSFYAGGKSATAAARKFGNVFQQVQNTARGYQERIPGMAAQGAADRATSEAKAAGRETDRKNALFESAQSGYRDTLENNRRTNNGPDSVNRMDNLSWLLRTGRISAEQMYAAQKDQNLYNELLKRGDSGSSGNAPRR